MSALLLATVYTTSPASAQSINIKPPSPLTCGNNSNAVPLYRSILEGNNPNSNCFLTTVLSEVTFAVKNGFTFDGVAARVFSTQETSTVPFFRLVTPPDRNHFYTISTSERDLALASGFVDQGNSSFIYPSQICGSIPLYRIYQSATTQHFYTISATNRDAMLAGGGWVDEGIAGYVLDLNDSCA
ncbi:hypothetical protein DFH09DRAFT_1319568 [Mycena vulgaris]|nr:hypothetical protein DFH09DRAFT_1319568 [Mycena vulgaris]